MDIHKIRSALPIEITGAFLAIQAFMNDLVGRGSYMEWMIPTILLLIILNAIYTYFLLTKNIIVVGFSCLGFLLWAITIDYVRFETSLISLFINYVPPKGVELGLYITSTLYGLIVFLFMTIRGEKG